MEAVPWHQLAWLEAERSASIKKDKAHQVTFRVFGNAIILFSQLQTIIDNVQQSQKMFINLAYATLSVGTHAPLNPVPPQLAILLSAKMWLSICKSPNGSSVNAVFQDWLAVVELHPGVGMRLIEWDRKPSGSNTSQKQPSHRSWQKPLWREKWQLVSRGGGYPPPLLGFRQQSCEES